MKKSNPKVLKLTDHFFRHEYSKMLAVISRYFNTADINLAEDIVQDTLLEAINNWEFKGIPPDPTAWLYTVAKNKTLNTLKQQKTRRKTNAQLTSSKESTIEISTEEMFSEHKISDDLLRMMFVCCHPLLNSEAQIAFTLKTLCGLSIEEIAHAFLTSTETINKRLVRARTTLRENKIALEIPKEKHLEERLEAILKVIYLLFNEGYNATKGSVLIRNELCVEAIRLTELILSNTQFKNNSTVSTLLALMYLNGSRFDSRIDSQGNIIEMSNQDRTKWNTKMIDRGLFLLGKIKEDGHLSIYHILATISALHCTALRYEDTDWASIKLLYEQLMSFDKSPIVKLNHAISLAKVEGNQKGIKELLALESTQKLDSYAPFYSAIANLYLEEQLFKNASQYFQQALNLTKTDLEIRVLRSKLDECKINS